MLHFIVIKKDINNKTILKIKNMAYDVQDLDLSVHLSTNNEVSKFQMYTYVICSNADYEI